MLPACGEEALPDPTPVPNPNKGVRIAEARGVRVEAAAYQASRPVPTHVANGDEALYPDHVANFTKALPHDDKGHVVEGAYEAPGTR